MQAHPDTGVIVLDMLKKVTGAAAGKSLYDEQSKVGDALTPFCHRWPALSIIVVHHSRKAESDDPFDLVSGTTGLSGSYDSLAALAELAPHQRMAWAIMDLRRNLKGVAVAQRHVARLTVAHWVVAQVRSHVAAIRVSAVRPEVSAEKHGSAAFRVYRVAGHNSSKSAHNNAIKNRTSLCSAAYGER